MQLLMHKFTVLLVRHYVYIIFSAGIADYIGYLQMQSTTRKHALMEDEIPTYKWDVSGYYKGHKLAVP